MAELACVVLWALYSDWAVLQQAADDHCHKLVHTRTYLVPPLEAFLFMHFERIVADALSADVARSHGRRRRAATTLFHFPKNKRL